MYRPLGKKTQQTRLIRLRKQGSSSSSDAAAETALALEFLSCTISLDSPKLQDFTALSYVWGPKDPGKHKISLDRYTLDITPNLDAALRNVHQLEDLSSQWIPGYGSMPSVSTRSIRPRETFRSPSCEIFILEQSAQ